MAGDNPVFHSGLKASTDLSSYQYYLVELTNSTTRQVSVCNAATDRAMGVLYDKPTAAAQAAQVAAFVPGTVVKVKVGASGVTAGWVGTDSSGMLVTKTTDKDWAIGLVDASGDSGDIVEVFCMPCYIAV